MEERPEELSAGAGVSELRNDPDFRPILLARQQLWNAEVAALLEAAREAGELVACDTAELSRTMNAALTRAIVIRSPEDGPLMDRYAAIFDTIIGPYRTSAN